MVISKWVYVRRLVARFIIIVRPTDSPQEPVTENYRVLLENVYEQANNHIASRTYKSILAPLQIFAIAAYQVTYNQTVRCAAEARLGKRSDEELVLRGLEDFESEVDALSMSGASVNVDEQETMPA
jgi:hypothetical protein